VATKSNFVPVAAVIVAGASVAVFEPWRRGAHADAGRN
jgi:hypothetical protein